MFHDVSQACSQLTTERYSTSFSSAIRLLNKEIQTPIYNIYGFVRFADEIVDTFHEQDKEALLAEFAKVGVSSTPYAFSLDPSGETVLGLIEADPFKGAPAPEPVLADADWIALQTICDG